MSQKNGINYAGTKDVSTDSFDLDGVDFDAIEENNTKRIDSQEAPEPSNDCGDSCVI